MTSFEDLQNYLDNYTVTQVSKEAQENSESSSLNDNQVLNSKSSSIKQYTTPSPPPPKQDTKKFDCLSFNFNQNSTTVQTVQYKSKNKSKHPNRISNTHYTVWSFIPLILYNQFKYFFNLYFLVICISQFFPPLKVGFLFTYLCPLLLVLGFTMLKEGYDDINRWKRDNEVNNEVFEVLDLKQSQTQGQLYFRDEISQNLRQGDIVKLKHGRRVPSDVILLCEAQNAPNCYIKTDQLDGETDFKLRKMSRFLTIQRLCDYSTRAIFELEKPNKDMHELSGRSVFSGASGAGGVTPSVESLSLENAIFAGCTLASQVDVYAMVIYCGKETKQSLNTQKPRIKQGILDKEIDKLTFVCFGIELVLSVFFAAQSASPNQGIFYLNCFRFILLFNAVIPISMRVNIEIAKIAYSIFITKDDHMDHCIVRTTTIPESLGRVNMLMSDKTGTITANKMIFQCLCTKQQPYTVKNSLLRALVSGNGIDNVSDDVEPDLLQLQNEYKKTFTLDDYESNVMQQESSHQKSSSSSNVLRRTKGGVASRAENKTSDQSYEKMMSLNNAIKSLALCNQIIPQISNCNDPLNSVKYQGKIISFNSPSPDEISFALFAAQCGFIMTNRNDQQMVFQNPLNQSETIEILNIFPFSSRTKRMAIIVREDSQITVFAKGADSVMLSKCQNGDKMKYNWVGERVDQLASSGLRTLVFGQRSISEAEYLQFKEQYDKAQAAMTNRDQLVYQAEESIICNLDLTAVTGVEDLLQKDVKQSIQEIRKAGIKVFLLTGDKIETSKNIARSTGFIEENQQFLELSVQSFDQFLTLQNPVKNHGNPLENSQIYSYIQLILQQLANNDFNDVLILDGQMLQTIIDTIPSNILKSYNFEALKQQGPAKLTPPRLVNQKSPLQSDIADLFIKTAQKCNSLIVSRCSPEQKALVTKLISIQYGKGKKPLIAAIGDGGNDCSMLQAADVAFGIRGLEGNQASLAADFSIAQFCDIRHLMFWHGRNSYIRSSNMSQFVMNRGITITLIQAVFSACFYYSSIPLFTGWLLLGYSVVYTSLPAVAVVLDTDVTRDNVLTYPELYRENLKGRKCNLTSFLKWFTISVYQGSVIGIFSNALTGQNFYNIVGVSFSCLIVAELLTLGFGIKKWTIWMVLSEVASIVVYFLSILCLPDVFDYQYVFSWKFWGNSIAVTLIALLPPFVVKWIMQCIKPDTVDKIRSQNRREKHKKEYKSLFDIKDIM